MGFYAIVRQAADREAMYPASVGSSGSVGHVVSLGCPVVAVRFIGLVAADRSSEVLETIDVAPLFAERTATLA
ncbi:MAG: hypothetical protein R3B90_23500 [Planctomycetaceae bacterium]